MKDFQDYLKTIIEGDAAAAVGGGDPTPARPGVSLDAANNPSEAYMAYKQELSALWQTMKGTLVNADKALETIQQHLTDFTSDAIPLKNVDATVDAAYATKKPRPTIDRSAISAMTNRAKQAVPGAGPTAPPTI